MKTNPGRIAFFNNFAITAKGAIINLETNEEFSACNDPLCNHQNQYCEEMILKLNRSIMTSPSSTPDDLILYMTRTLFGVTTDEESQPLQALANDQIIRYHYYTGELVVLCEHLPGSGSSFYLDPKTENLIFYNYVVTDSGKEELALYIVNGWTGECRIVPTPDMNLSLEYAIDDTLYFRDFLSNAAYSMDLSREKLALDHAEMIDCIDISNGYAYYLEKVGEERLYVPDDILPLCEQYKKESFQDFELYDLYRVNIMDKDAQPELVAERVSSRIGCVENYVYYYEFAPEYLLSYFSYVSVLDRKFGNYRIDDPSVPHNAILFNVFAEEMGALHILDADTLEPVAVIDAEQYEISPPGTFSNSGVFIDFDGCEIEDFLEDSGRVARKSGYIPFNKPFLTDEDIIPLQWN